MSRKITITGASGGVQNNLFLDIYPDTEYYFSLNRGKTGATIDVCLAEKAGNIEQDFTSEELESAVFDTFANGEEVRLSFIYNQSFGALPWFGTSAFSGMPNIGNPNLYKFNDKMYMSAVERNCVLQTPSNSGIDSILDKDSTIYIVFRSQNNNTIQGLIEERSLLLNANRVALYSDLRNTSFMHSNYAPTGANNFLSFNNQQPQETIRIYTLRRTGNIVEAFDENGLIDSTISNDSFSGATLFSLFWQRAGFLHFRGHIAEVIIREQSDNNTILNNIINHRKNYYGI